MNFDTTALEELVKKYQMVPRPPQHFVSTPHAQLYKQFRFPKSKRGRIHRKWAKQPRNWRFEPCSYRLGDTLYMHPMHYARLANYLSVERCYGQSYRPVFEARDST